MLGKRWSRQKELERQFNVDIIVDKGLDGDARISVIVRQRSVHDKMASVNEACTRIYGIIDGSYISDSDEDEDVGEGDGGGGVEVDRKDGISAVNQREVDEDENAEKSRDVEKKVYKISEEVKNLTEEEIGKWREDNNNIKVAPVEGYHAELSIENEFTKAEFTKTIVLNGLKESNLIG